MHKLPILALVLSVSTSLQAKKEIPIKVVSPLEAVKSHVHYRVLANTERLEAIINETRELSKEFPLFTGPKAVEATMALQIGIAIWESGLKESVEYCNDRGDNGQAYGLPQIHSEHFPKGVTPADVCLNRKLQWKIQNEVLHKAKRFCKSVNEPNYEDKGPIAWTANYHSGNKECKPDQTSYGHITYFTNLIRRMGIQVYKSGKHWVAK